MFQKRVVLNIYVEMSCIKFITYTSWWLFLCHWLIPSINTFLQFSYIHYTFHRFPSAFVQFRMLVNIEWVYNLVHMDSNCVKWHLKQLQKKEKERDCGRKKIHLKLSHISNFIPNTSHCYWMLWQTRDNLPQLLIFCKDLFSYFLSLIVFDLNEFLGAVIITFINRLYDDMFELSIKFIWKFYFLLALFHSGSLR